MYCDVIDGRRYTFRFNGRFMITSAEFVGLRPPESAPIAKDKNRTSARSGPGPLRRAWQSFQGRALARAMG